MGTGRSVVALVTVDRDSLDAVTRAQSRADSDAASSVSLTGRLVEMQRLSRVPSVTAAVGRNGCETWERSVGFADLEKGVEASPTAQYRIGSITKTFTAAVVLLLAHENALDVDECVERYLPGTPVGRATLSQLLAHHGGVQREAATDMWSTMRGPDSDTLRQTLSVSGMVAAPGQRWHYSNLGYAILGLIVEAVTGRPCAQVIQDRLWSPLGLMRTTWQADEPFARGYRIDPYDDIAHPEPDMRQGAVGVGGQAWSTAADLIVWANALTAGVPDVVPAAVVTAMHTLTVLVDPRDAAKGWGLGLILNRQNGRTLAGHTGAVPGFQAALLMDQSTGAVAVVLSSATRGLAVADLARDLLLGVDDPAADDATTQPHGWRPGPACPAHLRPVLGRWWSEAEEIVISWRDGELQARAAGGSADPTVFTDVAGSDQLVAHRGPWAGESLEIVRDDDGLVRQLAWATYPLTRTPR